MANIPSKTRLAQDGQELLESGVAVKEAVYEDAMVGTPLVYVAEDIIALTGQSEGMQVVDAFVCNGVNDVQKDLLWDILELHGCD